MRLRRLDTCVGCSAELAAGTPAAWYPDERVVRCLGCADGDSAGAAPATAAGRAGESARREHERRARRRQEEVRRRHPRIGGLLLALTDEPVST
nr:NERD domain-containing protein [Pseudonocardiales bacterium]